MVVVPANLFPVISVSSVAKKSCGFARGVLRDHREMGLFSGYSQFRS
jgi:hypothetical protein